VSAPGVARIGSPGRRSTGDPEDAISAQADSSLRTVVTTSPTSDRDPELRYHVVQPDPKSEATLAFVFETIGLHAVRCDPPALWDGPHVVYGRAAATGPNGISIPKRPARNDVRMVQTVDQTHGELRPTMCHESLPFDVSWIPTPSLGRLSFVNNLFGNHS